MGKDVIFDYSKAAAFIHEEEIAGIKAGVQAARETLVEKTGAGNDFLGWIDLPVDYDKEEFGRIKKGGGEDSEGFRCPAGNRYRRFVSGRKSGDRVPVP